MSDLQTKPPPASSENSGDASGDSLQKLHKMSRTAGLGSGDYAAVNGLAVAAVLFGIGSALVVFDRVFLLVPAIAVTLAIVAWYKIRHSAGTQTGKGLCIAAIVLAVAFTAFLGSRQLLAYLEEKRNVGEVAAMCETLGKDLAAQNYDAAYDRFSSEFRNRVPKAEFISKLQQFQQYFGQIQRMRWNERIRFDVDNRTNDPLASTLALIDLANDKGTREEMSFRKVGDKWQVDDLPFVFPKQTQVIEGGSKRGPGPMR